MYKYKKLHRCHLPDLDLTVPVSHEITWGRPLSQEEIDRMIVLFEGPAAAKPSAKPKDQEQIDRPLSQEEIDRPLSQEEIDRMNEVVC